MKEPVEPRRLQGVKKKQEYTRRHAMALRSRRLSKLELNKLIAEHCKPVRKAPSRRIRKPYSDDDEPLILQVSPRNKIFKNRISMRRNGTANKTISKEMSPKPSTSKEIMAMNRTLKKRKPKLKCSKENSSEGRAGLYAVASEEPVIVDPEILKDDQVDDLDCPGDLITVHPPEDPNDDSNIPDDMITLRFPDNSNRQPTSQGEPITLHFPENAVATDNPATPTIQVATKNPVLSPVPFSPVEPALTEVLGVSNDRLVQLGLSWSTGPLCNTDSHQVSDVPMVSNDVPEELDEPMSLGEESVHLDDNYKSKIMDNDDVIDNKSEDVDDEVQDYIVPDGNYYKLPPNRMNQMLVCGSMSEIRMKSPEPVAGPSGMTSQFRAHDSERQVDRDTEERFMRSESTSQNHEQQEEGNTVSDLEPERRNTDQNLEQQQESDIAMRSENIAPNDEQEPETSKRSENTSMNIEQEPEISSRSEKPLLSKQPRLMMKLKSHMVHGKDLLSVSLIPRSEVQEEHRDYSLQEQEHLLDQLSQTLSFSLSEKTDDRTAVSEDSKERQQSQQLHAAQEGSLELDEVQIITASNNKESEEMVKNRIAAARKVMMRILMQKSQELTRNPKDNNYVYDDRYCVVDDETGGDSSSLKVDLEGILRAEMANDRHIQQEVDDIAKALEIEKDAKAMGTGESSNSDRNAPGPSFAQAMVGGTLVDAPVYYPSVEEFKEPFKFFENIWPEAVRYGISKVVPPPGWKPPCRVEDEMRFVVTNQYISRLFSRWGPTARELSAIKLCLQTQKVNYSRPAILDGVEVNLPKLYHLVQRHGGLETVINKKRWNKVAEDMKFKVPAIERKLDQIYVKYLLPYDTLSHQERQEIMRKVEMAWNKKNQKLLDRALNPLYRQKLMLGLINEPSDDELEDEDTAIAINDAEDCITKGGSMTLAKFRKVATMAFEDSFGPGSEALPPPDLSLIEEKYWRHVTLGTEPLCVHTAAIDTGEEGYGFPKNLDEPYGRHPWNPKMISQNDRNVLRYLGPVLGLTVPTLLLGMLFSTSCWHKDPHALPWFEYEHKGPTRIWYGIPSHQADNFRKAVETVCPTFCQNKGLWLSTDITMIPPHVLREHNVTLSRVTQNAGEIVVAFPNAYTCWISTGYTESESVYFAPPSWLDSLWEVFKEARESCEPTMFAIEHLLYNIGKDPTAEPDILRKAQPLFDRMLREEVNNRQMLQERGLPIVQDLRSGGATRKKSKANPFQLNDQAECEYCRATLFLSKVICLTGRNSILCLEHALKLLDTDKYKDTDVSLLEVLVHVSVKELNTVYDDMKRRIGHRKA